MDGRLKKVAAAVLSGGVLAVAVAVPASADPIVCPSGQTAQKTSSGWTCVNNGNNSTGAGFHQGNGNKI
jgi:hypothetical protein